MSGKKRIIVIVAAAVAALLLILYLGGMLGQVLQNYAEWRGKDGVGGERTVSFYQLPAPQAGSLFRLRLFL